jgi:hypothetical protein
MGLVYRRPVPAARPTRRALINDGQGPQTALGPRERLLAAWHALSGVAVPWQVGPGQ